MIYPLDHTNVALSGQVKLDIYLEKTDKGVRARKLKVSPISENIPFAYDLNTNDILRSHNYNIKKIKSILGSMFYDTARDITTNYFLPDKNLIANVNVKEYDNQYEAGLKRASFKKYGKQMQLFFPLWIEKWDDSLFDRIKIGPYTSGSKVKDNEEPIEWTPELKSYISNIFSRNAVDDDFLIKIDLNAYEAYIYGIDTNDGEYKKVDCNEIVNNLKDRERPLLEQNFMITNMFKSHELICKNILNINFVFDPCDVMNGLIGPHYNEDINIRAVLIDENRNIINPRDFYFNQYNINQLKISDSFIKSDTGESIFSKTHENYVYDYAYINKICPTICHWSTSLTQPSFFNTCSEFAYIDESGVKGSVIPGTSDFNSKSQSVFNDIYTFIDVEKWPAYSDEYPSKDEREKQIPYEQVMSVLNYSQTYWDTDDKNNAWYKSTISSKYSTLIGIGKHNKSDYSYNAGSNTIPGIDTSAFNNKNVYMRMLVYNDESESNKKSLVISKNVNNYFTITIGSTKLSELLTFDSFIEEFMNALSESSLNTYMDAFTNWFTSIKESNKLYKFVLTKSTCSKVHKCNDSSLIAYDLYKDDHSYVVIYRKTGKIYPYLIDATEKSNYINYYYKYRYASDKNVNTSYFGKKLYPNYVKDDKFFALECTDREGYLAYANGDGDPQFNSGNAHLRYLLTTKTSRTKNWYVSKDDAEKLGNPSLAFDPKTYFVELFNIDEKYYDLYDYSILELDEKIENGIIKYRYKINYSLK